MMHGLTGALHEGREPVGGVHHAVPHAASCTCSTETKRRETFYIYIYIYIFPYSGFETCFGWDCWQPAPTVKVLEQNATHDNIIDSRRVLVGTPGTNC